jgi:hypothetical protein
MGLACLKSLARVVDLKEVMYALNLVGVLRRSLPEPLAALQEVGRDFFSSFPMELSGKQIKPTCQSYTSFSLEF